MTTAPKDSEDAFQKKIKNFLQSPYINGKKESMCKNTVIKKNLINIYI